MRNEQWIQQIKRHSVRIQCKNKTIGTGYYVCPTEGTCAYVITAAHVLSNAVYPISVQIYHGNELGEEAIFDIGESDAIIPEDFDHKKVNIENQDCDCALLRIPKRDWMEQDASVLVGKPRSGIQIWGVSYSEATGREKNILLDANMMYPTINNVDEQSHFFTAPFHGEAQINAADPSHEIGGMSGTVYTAKYGKNIVLIGMFISTYGDSAVMQRMYMTDMSSAALLLKNEGISITEYCPAIIDQSYFEQLGRRKGTGGRFYQLTVETALIPGIHTEHDGHYVNKDGNGNPLLDCLNVLWNGEHRHALLLADGGMGKSSAILNAWECLLGSNIPAIYIPLQEVSENNENIENMIIGMYGDSIAHINSRYDRVVLFLDGFNEVKSKAVRGIAASIKSMSALENIQIVIASRTDFRAVYGMKYIEGVTVEKLTNRQVDVCFSEEKVKLIKSKPYLYELLHNPMMLTIYEKTDSIMLQSQGVSWLQWKSDIITSGDLLWNFYQAQCASALLNTSVDGEEIVRRVLVIRYILPKIAYDAFVSATFEISEEQLENSVHTAVCDFKQIWSRRTPNVIKTICMEYEILFNVDSISEYDMMTVLINKLHLLAKNNGSYAFLHQIHRDYMAAMHLFLKLDSLNEWKSRIFDETIYQYIRSMTQDEWQENGAAHMLLNECRAHPEEKYLLTNTLNCWLPKDVSCDLNRNLRNLDLREYRLSDHLLHSYSGEIDITNSWVSEYTFIDNVKHDAICAVDVSNSGRYVAIFSENGILSLYDRELSYQRILLKAHGADIKLYFTIQDYLILKCGNREFCWNTELFDRYEEMNRSGDEPVTSGLQPELSVQMYQILKNNHQLGICHAFSRDGRYIAAGHKDGLVEVWDCCSKNLANTIRLGISRAVCAAFSTDGTLCAVTSGGRAMQLF